MTHKPADKTAEPDKHRIDKWLWAARFFKTRSLAVDEIDKGRISINGQVAKASREVRVGDQVEIRQTGGLVRAFDVLGLSNQRGPAPEAQALFRETPDSLARRDQYAQQRRLAAEPSLSIEQGRPTKRDRRQLADWQRWSASSDDS